MKIGFCYDTKSDYGFEEENMEYTDFVSLNTISEIKHAIEQNGYEVGYIGNVHKLKKLLENHTFPFDLVFNIAEGFRSRNREALIPSLLEIYDIPVTASDTYGMAVNLNKYHTKILVKSLGIPVPKDVYFEQMDQNTLGKILDLKFPLVLKPNSEGGSMGLYLIQTVDELKEKAQFLIEKYSFDLLAEEYISGTEVTVPVIGNGDDAKALGVVSIIYKDGSDLPIFDSCLKKDDDLITTLDFKYSNSIKQKLIEYSVRIHNFFHLRDYSRMDFRISPNGNIYFLEINTMPSLARGGSFEICGNSMGLEYYEIIGRIIESAKKRSGI